MDENGAIRDTSRMREIKMRMVQMRGDEERCIVIDRAHHLRCILDVVELKQKDWRMQVFSYSVCSSLRSFELATKCKAAQCSIRFCAFRRAMLKWRYESENF